jgi:hypothetical protein
MCDYLCRPSRVRPCMTHLAASRPGLARMGQREGD